MSRRTGLSRDAIAAPRAACDHGAAAGWQLQSTHRTSEGTVAYARCPCGALLVLLDGQPLAVLGITQRQSAAVVTRRRC
jgi:hypothetical protein